MEQIKEQNGYGSYMITLKTLPTATEQEVFDQVATHLIRQCRKSLKELSLLRPVGAGAYRGDDGLKCAAGCLIADDEYDIGMERILWGGLVSQGKVPKEHWLLIDALQIVHDWMDKPDDIHSWISALKYVAERYNLEFKISDYLPPQTHVENI